MITSKPPTAPRFKTKKKRKKCSVKDRQQLKSIIFPQREREEIPIKSSHFFSLCFFEALQVSLSCFQKETAHTHRFINHHSINDDYSIHEREGTQKREGVVQII